MLRTTYLILVVLILVSACYRPAPKQSFEDLKILEGKWATVEGAQFNEVWKIANDSLIIGIGYSLNGNDTVFKEQLKIYRIGNKVKYAAKVSENSDFVLFGLNESGKNRWKFVNPGHDYPNIIEYKLLNDSILEASTSNNRDNKEIRFRFKKVN